MATSSISKIPPFDEKYFAMWKSNAMVVLKSMDHNMMDIIDKGPYIPTYDETKYGFKTSVIKKTRKDQFNEEEKMFNLDIRARSGIRNSLMISIILFRFVFQQKKLLIH